MKRLALAALLVLLSACPSREASPAALAAQATAQGDAALAAGDLAQAEVAFERASSLGPLDPAPLIGLGTTRLRQGRSQEAILVCKRAVELAPERADAHRLLGEAYLASRRFDLAIASLEKAASLGDPGSRSSLSRALLGKGQPAEAAKQAQAALLAKPDDGGALVALAEVRLAEQDVKAAASLLDKAVAANANDPQVRLARGRFFLSRGGHAEAATEAEAARRLLPSSPEPAELLARALLAGQKFPEARAAAKVTGAQGPAAATLLALQARAALGEGDTRAARQLSDDAAKLVPGHVDALLARAEVVAATSDASAAIAAYEDASRSNAGPDAESRLAALYRKAQRHGDALGTLERLVREHPERWDDCLALIELRIETGVGVSEGIKLAKRMREERPGEVRLLELLTKLETAPRRDGLGQPRAGPSDGIEIIRGK